MLRIARAMALMGALFVVVYCTATGVFADYNLKCCGLDAFHCSYCFLVPPVRYQIGYNPTPNCFFIPGTYNCELTWGLCATLTGTVTVYDPGDDNCDGDPPDHGKVQGPININAYICDMATQANCP
ncbi:MAG: hypothetical protein HYS13_16330 [Planctomycetia bacterium]|nr:hypothetical protein [Planctomycetia bacterium]